MKKLGIEGLGAVWIKIFSLIQLVTGNVDVKNKGDLQTQINRLDQKIPTVANGKFTIQKNGVDIQSFTANQSGDATANIIVPNTTRSAAVTQEGQLSLDAIEKNAAIPGTLAHELAQTNSKLEDRQKIIKQITVSLEFSNTLDGFVSYCDYDFGKRVTVISVNGTTGSWVWQPVGATDINGQRVWRFSSRIITTDYYHVFEILYVEL